MSRTVKCSIYAMVFKLYRFTGSNNFIKKAFCASFWLSCLPSSWYFSFRLNIFQRTYFLIKAHCSQINIQSLYGFPSKSYCSFDFDFFLLFSINCERSNISIRWYSNVVDLTSKVGSFCQLNVIDNLFYSISFFSFMLICIQFRCSFSLILHHKMREKSVM